jgi:hypothetical protein
MKSVVAEYKRERRGARPLPVVPSAPSTGGRAAAAPEPVNWAPALCLLGASATAALVGTPVGLLLGYWSGTGQLAQVPWVGLVQAHGQAQVFGWLGLAILGVTFHAMAHLFRAAEPPARAAFAALALQVTGVVLRLAAPLVPGAAGAGGAWMLLGSAVAFLGAFGITLEAHARTLPRRSRTGRAPAVLPRFLLAGVLLWLAALLANLDGAIAAVRFGPVAPGALDATRDAFIVAAATGGFALIAAGMSLRVAVGWLDLPAPDLRRAAQAWGPLAGAALLRSLAPVAGGLAAGTGTALDVAGALLWAAGVAWYLPALRGLWSPETLRIGGGTRGEADPPLAWFVRTAYTWFALSGLLSVAYAALLLVDAIGFTPLAGSGGAVTVTGVADAARHALLFGYLGTLTAGLAGRLPTAFLDVGDAAVGATRGLYRATWLLLLPAAALRVGAPLSGEARPALVVASGALGAAGLVCLLAALLRVVRLARRLHRRSAAG